ncbi:Transcription factor bHLH25 [Camellia lanceoleosa]|uniref:Transcription factor bHLH25 n=1 Tax=Camellia lanceoleosa TaxID=1840588 RepID=A0ACC0J4U2_9ERIC|nr:Transcription factor bHLH25 [Camellia lanceoleosa]
MDTSPAKWLSEMGMEEPAVIHQCQMNSLNHSVHEIISLSSETYSTTSYPYFYPKSTPFQTSQMASSMIAKPEAKQLKPNDWNSHKNNEKFKPLNPRAFSSSSSSSKFISFANSNAAPPDCSKQLHGNVNCTLKSKPKSNTNMKFSFILSQNSNENPLEFGGVETQRVCTTNTTTTRTPLQAQDHVVAERKRREKLSQRFIALSALVPGLKKVLLHYVCTQVLPEVAVRVSENYVIVRIQCEKQNRFIAKIFSEMEKLHLIVINSSVIPFGHSILSINIIAQMDPQFSVIANDLAKSLRSAIQDVLISPPAE